MGQPVYYIDKNVYDKMQSRMAQRNMDVLPNSTYINTMENVSRQYEYKKAKNAYRQDRGDIERLVNINYDDSNATRETYIYKGIDFRPDMIADMNMRERATPIIPILNQVAKELNFDPVVAASIISQESGWNVSAISKTKAGGLMQLMPGTANEMGVSDVNNPESNIRGGIKYMLKMLEANDWNFVSALASYNGGLANVQDYKRGTNKQGNNPKLRRTEHGIPNFKETKDYVVKVMNNYNNYYKQLDLSSN